MTKLEKVYREIMGVPNDTKDFSVWREFLEIIGGMIAISILFIAFYLLPILLL